MKVINIRLKESTVEWLKDLADKEKIPLSTMIRTFLEREEYADFIKDKLNSKKRV